MTEVKTTATNAAANTEPRIAPLGPPYEPELEQMLRRWMPPGSPLEPLVLFRTLAVHDELFSRMRPLGAGILGHGRVEPRHRELMILRTCARAGAEYEWGVHAVAFGDSVGLSEDQLAATAGGSPEAACWSQDERALIRLADELHDTGGVSDATWTALGKQFTDDQLLELVIIAGWYRLLSYVINAARVQPESWAARFPDAGDRET
jgi:4-carboxymuconolactone decarboxylase